MSPALEPGQIRLVCARIDDVVRGALVLDAGERARAAAITRADDARAFVAARTVLRRLLGHELACDGESIEIVETASGKPRLAGVGDLEFNVSHGGELVVVALARGRAVGVDVEPMIASRRRIDDISELSLGPRALEHLRSVPASERGAMFTRWWVRCEAVCKATGVGLIVPLEDDVPDGIHVEEISVGPGHAAAVAWSGGAATIEIEDQGAGS
ncbi:MAG: 4-phosphopantetheinyl transferase [Myxococcales bacterium]|nr:4-phosphopantetheinyl transferase [Myxococcales bacterium]